MANGALAVLIVLPSLGLMTRDAERAVGQQPADRRGIVARVAPHVRVNGRGVVGLQGGRAVAVGARPCGCMVILVTGGAVRGVSLRRQRDRLRVAVGTAHVRVGLVTKVDLAGPRLALRHDEASRRDQRRRELRRGMALGAVALAGCSMMADLAAARRLEGKTPVTGTGLVAVQAA